MKYYPAYLSWAIALSIPFFLIMLGVRLLMTPLFLQFEYNLRPGFPSDPYGFTTADRLRWGGLSVEYLVNDADLSFLADQELEPGIPLYNERELSHMLDVKVLVQQASKIWYLQIGTFIILGIWAWKARWLADYLRGFSRGGWLTIGLIVTALVFVLTSFNALFTAFHQLFFTGDTWLFLYTDSLIRLFPLMFWQDAFILVGVICLGGGLLFGRLGQRWAVRAR
ncbi:MAG: TIGR01906 family membrane protein [Chloroflexi bacterium]|nr:TIGR01906 family membrane protein [Chloroflexota bacterium]